MDEEPKDPIIFGRLFLATAGAIIDVKGGKIDLHLGLDEVLEFDINQTIKRPTIDGQCFYIEEMDSLADELLEEIRIEDGLEVALTMDHKGNGFVTKESQAYELTLDQESTLDMGAQVEDLASEMEAKGVEEARNDSSTVGEDDWSELKAPKVDLKELPSGLRLHAYESSSIYKERTKAFHDKKILAKDIKPGDQVLLFNSRLKLFLGKLKTRWSGPFVVKEARSYGAVVLVTKDGQEFVTNGQRLKKYHAKEIIQEAISTPLDDAPTTT